MSQIIGSFVFRNEGDGCLTGKYINNGLDTPVPECCKLKTAIGMSPFEGVYISTWIEGTTSTVCATLKIEKFKEIYKLEWSKNNDLIFEGQAMLHENLLIGHYYTKL